MSTAGHVAEQSTDCSVVSARLFNFAINKSTLHSKHEEWLLNHVLPVLEGGGSVALLGLASRSGSAAYNRRLSRRRAQTVQRFLNSPSAVGNFFVDSKTIEAGGESYAKLRGVKDGTEDGFERAVVISAWCKPDPPPVRWSHSPKNPDNLVDRVHMRIYRNKVIEQGGGRAQRYLDGEGGVQLAEMLKQLYDKSVRGDTGTVRKQKVYYEHVVTKVEEISETYRHHAISASGYTEYLYTYRYTWGPKTSHVMLVRREIKDGETVQEYRFNYPRKEVWKHTKHPQMGRSTTMYKQ